MFTVFIFSCIVLTTIFLYFKHNYEYRDKFHVVNKTQNSKVLYNKKRVNKSAIVSHRKNNS